MENYYSSGPISSAAIPPIARAEIKTLVRSMEWIGWSNLVVGSLNIACFLFVANDSDYVMTGILSLCAFGLVRMKKSHLEKSTRWVSASMTLLCGLFLPFLILLLASANLLETL